MQDTSITSLHFQFCLVCFRDPETASPLHTQRPPTCINVYTNGARLAGSRTHLSLVILLYKKTLRFSSQSQTHVSHLHCISNRHCTCAFTNMHHTCFVLPLVLTSVEYTSPSTRRDTCCLLVLRLLYLFPFEEQVSKRLFVGLTDFPLRHFRNAEVGLNFSGLTVPSLHLFTCITNYHDL